MDFQAGGIVDKTITGPWMRLFYKPHDDEMHHLDVVPHVRKALTVIDQFIDQPNSILKGEDIFGSSVHKDEVWNSLISDISVDVLRRISGMAAAIKKIVTRQMAWYIDHDPTDEERDLSASAPLHNIEAERIMGMMDAMKRRSKTASMLNISSKIRAKHSGTLEWLANLDGETQEEIIQFSVLRGRAFRSEIVERQLQVERKIVERVKEKQQKRTDRDRKVLEKKVKLVIEGGEFRKVFSDKDYDVKEELVTKVIEHPKILEGKTFEHVYNLEHKRTDYSGEVLEVNYRVKSRDWVCTVVYGKRDNLELDEYDLTLKELLTDYILGDFKVNITH